MEQFPDQSFESIELDLDSPEITQLLPAPPEGQYRSDTEAVQAIKTFAQDNLYAVITKRTNKGRNGTVEAIYLTCDQGHEYRSTAQRRKRTASRRKGCPFSILVSYHKSDCLWHVKVRNGSHNHGPSLPSSHPSIRREEITQKTQYIKALLDIQMPPSQILKQLRHVDPNSIIQLRDIYNLRHRLYQGKTPVPAVLSFRPVGTPQRSRPSGSASQFPESIVSAIGKTDNLQEGFVQGVVGGVQLPRHSSLQNHEIPQNMTDILKF